MSGLLWIGALIVAIGLPWRSAKRSGSIPALHFPQGPAMHHAPLVDDAVGANAPVRIAVGVEE
jgi:hypothetical protein